MNPLQIALPLAAPPWPGLGKKLEGLVRKACYDFELLEETSSIAVALSGGKDSLTLLYMLAAIKGRGFATFDLHAIHVSGAFSCGASINERYLKGICDSLGVSFTICHSQQERETLECYSCSRERRKLLFAASKKLGAPTIAFGHHRDDHVQTLLLNLLQKGEIEGNMPKVKMHLYETTIIRPLIYVSEEDILAFAKAFNFARITCQCPIGQTSKRKKIETHIRNMEKDFPHLRSNIASAALRYGSKKALRNELLNSFKKEKVPFSV